MADSHASAGWPGQQGPMPARELARHMLACAPCAQSLLDTARDGRPGRRVARRDRPDALLVDSVMARALDDGEVKAALVIYDMARASLALVPDYAANVDIVGLDQSFPDLKAEACALDVRLRPSSREAIARLPQGLPSRDTAVTVAGDCIAVAARITRNWWWINFMHGHIAMAAGELGTAHSTFEAILARGVKSDPRLDYWTARNRACVAILQGSVKGVSEASDYLLKFSRSDAAARFLRIEIGISTRDRKLMDNAALELRRCLEEAPTESPYWRRSLVERAGRLQAQAPGTATWLKDLALSIPAGGAF